MAESRRARLGGGARRRLAGALPLLILASIPSRVVRNAAGTRAVAITNASVIPMDAERVLRGHTVLVEGDRIAAVGPDSSIALPPDATRVDARGAYVLPGLIDMHVHIREAELRSYVEHGVTSVRNMWGYAALPALVHHIETSELVGPAIYSASPGLDGTPSAWPETQIIEDPALADAVVAAQVAAGWRFIKVYNNLTPAVYDAIVAAARSRGIRVVGHVPTRVALEHALDSGQTSIEHLRGYEFALTRHPGTDTLVAWSDIDASRIPYLAARTAVSGAWNCPTLAIWQIFARGLDEATRARVLGNRAAMVRGLRDAGARLLAGTDSGIDQTAPGTSLHDELADLVAVGLSPYEAIRAATADAAVFLKEEMEIGSIAPGRRADLLIVERNPLEEVEALRSTSIVILRGVWYFTDASRQWLMSPLPPTRRIPRALDRR